MITGSPAHSRNSDQSQRKTCRQSGRISHKPPVFIPRLFYRLAAVPELTDLVRSLQAPEHIFFGQRFRCLKPVLLKLIFQKIKIIHDHFPDLQLLLLLPLSDSQDSSSRHARIFFKLRESLDLTLPGLRPTIRLTSSLVNPPTTESSTISLDCSSSCENACSSIR